MKVITKTKNLELTDELKRFIDVRVGGLRKFKNILIGDFQEAIVDVKRETTHHRKGDIFIVNIILQIPGQRLVAKSRGDNLKNVIVQARDEIEREIRKYKLEVIHLPRRQARKSKGKL